MNTNEWLIKYMLDEVFEILMQFGIVDEGDNDRPTNLALAFGDTLVDVNHVGDGRFKLTIDGDDLDFEALKKAMIDSGKIDPLPFVKIENTLMFTVRLDSFRLMRAMHADKV